MPDDATPTIDNAKAGARHSAADNALLKDSRQKLREIDANLVALGTPEDPAPEAAAEGEPAAPTDNALKAISSTPDELRVGNHIILFGGRDLAGYSIGAKAPLYKNADGTQGEFFTKNTRLDSPFTATGRLPQDWEHNREPEVVGPDAVLGYVDWSTKRITDKGVFVERVLNRHNQYVKWLEELIPLGIVGTSSQSMAGRGRVKATGEITDWPLERDTLTITPAEPRMKGENVIAALKALGISAEPGQAAPDGASADTSSVKTTGDFEMDEQELKALRDGMAALSAGNAELKAQNAELLEELRKPALKALAAVQPVPDDPKPFKSLGEQMAAIVKAVNAPAYADPRIAKVNSKATGMNEGTLSDGGAFVQTDFSNTLLERAYAMGAFLSRTAKQTVGQGFNAYGALLIDETSRAEGSRSGAVQMYWIGEGGTYTASRPKLRRYELKLGKLVGLVYATDENLQDAAQLESLIMREYPKEFDFQANNKIFRGSGAGEPMGVLNAPGKVSVAKETGQAAATVVYQNLLKMWSRMWAPSRATAIWLYNQDVEPQLFSMALAVGTAALEAKFVQFDQNGQLRIFGRPAFPLEQASTLGTQGDIALVDPEQYLTVGKGSLDVASSIHVAFTTGEQTFRFTARFNGGPLWNSALTPAQGTNTLSPYVVLDTRA